jgi:hypothetical protein
MLHLNIAILKYSLDSTVIITRVSDVHMRSALSAVSGEALGAQSWVEVGLNLGGVSG